MGRGAAAAGLLGGLAWIAALVVDRTSAGSPVDALSWAGVALLVVAALGAGAGLVSRSAPWLRLLVAVCFTALAASVTDVLREGGDPLVVDAVVGFAAAVVAVVALSRARPGEPAATRHAGGSHAR